MGLCALTLSVCPQQIFEVFTNNSQMLKIGIPILHIASLYLMFDGFQVCLSGILKGLKMTKTASISVIAGYWFFGLPLGFILAYHFKMSLLGFWIGLATSFLFLSAIMTTIIIRKFKSLSKKYKKTTA